MFFFIKPMLKLKQLFEKKLSKTCHGKENKAFTLVEVLVSSVILAVGLVIIFEVFLTSLDIVNLFNNRLSAQLFLDEKIWQLQSSLDQTSGMFIPNEQSGIVSISGRDFKWQLDMELVDLTQETFKVAARVDWTEGQKQRNIKRQTIVKSYFSNANPW